LNRTVKKPKLSNADRTCVRQLDSCAKLSASIQICSFDETRSDLRDEALQSGFESTRIIADVEQYLSCDYSCSAIGMVSR
jgi:hypothetical protein